MKNGKEIEFVFEEKTAPTKDEEDKWDSWKRESSADTGMNTCLIIGGSAGLVLLTLVIIGALAQK